MSYFSLPPRSPMSLVFVFSRRQPSVSRCPFHGDSSDLGTERGSVLSSPCPPPSCHTPMCPLLPNDCLFSFSSFQMSSSYVLSFFKKIFYLFIYERHRYIETGRDTGEGEAGSTQGAQCGTRSQVSSITPWAEGGAKPLSHPGCPPLTF